jgi:hypothetical protein
VHADTKAKIGSAYNLYVKYEEEGRDSKPVEGTQTQLPPMAVGNSQKAIAYGAQQLDLMQRNGWHTIFDSYNKDRPTMYAGRSSSQSASHGGTPRGASSAQAPKGGAKGAPGAMVSRESMQAGRGVGAQGSPSMQQYSKAGMMPVQSGAARPGQHPAGSAVMRPGMNPVCFV